MKLTLYMYSILLWYGCVALASLVNNDFNTVSFLVQKSFPTKKQYTCQAQPGNLSHKPVHSCSHSRVTVRRMDSSILHTRLFWHLSDEYVLYHQVCKYCKYHLAWGIRYVSLYDPNFHTIKMLKGYRWTQTGQSINAIGFQLS